MLSRLVSVFFASSERIFIFFFNFLFVTVPLRLSQPVQCTKLATRVNASD